MMSKKSTMSFEEKRVLFEQVKAAKKPVEIAKPKREGVGQPALEWEEHPLIAPVLQGRREHIGYGLPVFDVSDKPTDVRAALARSISTRLNKVYGKETLNESWSVWVVDGSIVISCNGTRITRTRKGK